MAPYLSDDGVDTVADYACVWFLAEVHHDRNCNHRAKISPGFKQDSFGKSGGAKLLTAFT